MSQARVLAGSPAEATGRPTAPQHTDRDVTDSFEDRYSRQTAFPSIGRDGQARIQASAALLVGVGALGSHLASHLVRAGIGRLILVDRDVVEASNLQRQLLFDEAAAEAS